MAQPSFLETEAGRTLAYHLTPGRGPGVVFLGGFASDMEGTKAVHLEAWCRQGGRAFLRFDYSGHGQSSERFVDGAIGDWAEDAAAAIGALTQGPQVIVGSSMGGWISLLLAKRMPEKLAALVTIAAAPDFTERDWNGFSAEQRAAMMRDGRIERPSDYGAPYVITRRLIEDGRDNLVMTVPLHLPFPTRFLQGTADTDVPPLWATELLDHCTGPDMHLTLVKGADHRFSSAEALGIVEAALDDVLGRITN